MKGVLASSGPMTEDIGPVDTQALTEIVNALNRLEPEARRRILSSLVTLYGIDPPVRTIGSATAAQPSWQSPNRESAVSFSEDRTLSPKEFVWQKQPKSVIERVVCLGYYLQHIRGMASFKTSDIAELNTEAAQIKLSNPAMMVGEATRHGYFASVRGQEKQLTVVAEQLVSHLPDREAAAKAIKNVKPRRARRKNNAPKDVTPKP
jgi:hypothetical protein